MFHIEEKTVRRLLLNGRFGLERESLRVMPDGSFSHTLHPFSVDEKHIVYDFCENQTEINTDVCDSAEEAIAVLEGHVSAVCQRLESLPEKELLWPFSNPTFIRSESDIPIAKDKEAYGLKKGYREYLADRYGRYKMTFSGIHVNYSFDEELLKEDFHYSGFSDYREYKDCVYVTLAERVAAYGWIITALTAASPVLDGSYFEKGKRGETIFSGLASIRCSEMGYWNYFVPVFDYTDIASYTNSIQKYVDDGFIAAPRELYYPIRLKPKGEYNLQKLRDDGVDHIELRMVDVNPYERAGVSDKDLKFIQLLLIWLMGTDRQVFAAKDQIQAVSNFKNAAHYDLKTVSILAPNAEVYSVVAAGLKVIGFMRDFYRDFPDEIQEILAYQEAKFQDPEKRYAWRVRREFADGFAEKGLQYAKKMQACVLSEAYK